MYVCMYVCMCMVVCGQPFIQYRCCLNRDFMVCVAVIPLLEKPMIRELLQSDNSKYLYYSLVSKVTLKLCGIWLKQSVSILKLRDVIYNIK